MEYVIFVMILTVLKESHPLNPGILQYDQYMKDFETTGRRIKQEAKDEKMDGLDMKRRNRDLQNIFDEGVPCETKMGHVTPGRHRLYTPLCLVYFCEEYNSTNSELHEIQCQDYMEEKIPESFPKNASKVYRALCRRCFDGEIRIIENTALGMRR